MSAYQSHPRVTLIERPIRPKSLHLIVGLTIHMYRNSSLLGRTSCVNDSVRTRRFIRPDKNTNFSSTFIDRAERTWSFRVPNDFKWGLFEKQKLYFERVNSWKSLGNWRRASTLSSLNNIKSTRSQHGPEKESYPILWTSHSRNSNCPDDVSTPAPTKKPFRNAITSSKVPLVVHNTGREQRCGKNVHKRACQSFDPVRFFATFATPSGTILRWSYFTQKPPL